MIESELHKYFGYVNRWGSVYVKPYEPSAEIEAMQSPSVFKVFRFIEAVNDADAQTQAEQMNKDGKGMITVAGQRSGLK